MLITKYLYKTGFLLLFIAMCIQVFCNNEEKIDSLKNELTHSVNDSLKINILLKLFWEYQRANPDTALIFAEKALEISQANNFKENIAESKRYIGIFKKVQGDYHEALCLFEESKNYYLQTNDTGGIYTCLIDIGDVYYRQNNFLPAIEYYYEALELVLLSEDKETRGRIYHKLGGIYQQQKQYNQTFFNIF